LRWLAAGLAAVLVVAVVTAVLAVRAQRAADRTSLVADANRLAALSAEAESLDLTYLLAAQGFRLSDTPETRATLLGSLVDHRRVIRTQTFTGNGPLGSLADGGRTIFVGNDITNQIFSWSVDSPDEPRLVEEAEEGWEGWRATAPSPTDPVLLTAGTGESGPWMRTVDADGTVREVLSGAEVGGEPIGVAVLPDGRWARLLVAGANDASQTPWRVLEVDLVDGTRRETGVRGVAPGALDDLKVVVSEDGGTALLVDQAGASVAFVDLGTGRVVPLEVPPDEPSAYFEFRILPTGPALLGSEGTVTLYDASGRVRQQFDAAPGQLNDLDLAPDGTWGVSAGAEGALVLWDVDASTGRWSEKEVLTGPRGFVGAAMIEPSGARMYTLSSDGMLTVWDTTPTGGFGAPRPGLGDRWIADEPAVVVPGELVVVPTRSFGTAVSGDFPYVGPGTTEVAATFVDPRTREIVDEVVVGDTLAESWSGASVAVSPDRSLLAITSGLAVTVLDARSRDPVMTFTVPPAGYPGPDGRPLPIGVVGPVTWSADGTRLLLGVQGGDPTTSQEGGALLAVDTDSWEITDETALDLVPEAVALSPDGRTVAVGGGWSGVMELRDAATLDARSTVALDDRIWDLAWSADGGLLLAGGDGGGLHAVEPGMGEARLLPFPADDARLQVEWLPDRRTVAVTGIFGTVRLYDIDRAVARNELPASAREFQTPRFMVPGPTDDLVVLSDNDHVMSYPMTPSAWLRAACDIVGRDLTRAEWDRYLPERPYTATCTGAE
jgi:WD40 repeat protein